MSETLINPNQIRDGIGGKIKILNVVQNGSLYRSDGTKFTNFSSSNYLTVGGVVQNGIFSQTQNVLNFGDFFSTADSWEINGSFILTSLSPNWEPIIAPTTDSEYNGMVIQKDEYNKFDFYFSKIDRIKTTNALAINTKYYLKAQFTGTQYKVWLNTDGQTYDNTTLIGTVDNSNKCGDIISFYIGRSSYGGEYVNGGEIDLADWNIKKNGEYWWKGIETI